MRGLVWRIGSETFMVLAFALAAATAGLSRARGDETLEPIRIEYRAESGLDCPAEPAFDQAVFARTSSARPARPGEQARTFIVELEGAGARVAGSLVVQEADGTTMARRVTGLKCADVAQVLALAAALAIDPRAELAPRETLPEARPPPQAHTWPSPAEAEPSTAGWLWRGALGASLAVGAAPNTALGGTLWFAARPRSEGLAPELGLEFVVRQSGATSVSDAQARFQFYTIRPSMCAAGLALGAMLGVTPCALLETGVVSGQGSQIPNATRQTRFWAALEALLRLEFALGDTWFLSLEGGLQLPLTRYRFVFENPETSIHDVPPVAMTSALRLGVKF